MSNIWENGNFDRVYGEDGMRNLENKKHLSCKIRCCLLNGTIIEAFGNIWKTHTATFLNELFTIATDDWEERMRKWQVFRVLWRFFGKFWHQIWTNWVCMPFLARFPASPGTATPPLSPLKMVMFNRKYQVWPFYCVVTKQPGASSGIPYKH